MLILVLGSGTKALAQVVTNTGDSGPGTLRDAINNATNDATITFAPNLSGAIITLSNTLTINTNLTIDASALTNGLQINGNGSVQIFNVAASNTVVLDSLTITNGSSHYGGGITNNGTLTLNQCTLSGNSAFVGGGIANFGTLMVNECILSGNNAGGGAGIYNDGTLTVNQSTIITNGVGHNGVGLSNNGGGIYNDDDGMLTLNECTLAGNGAHVGGGIFNNYGTLTVNQCTLAENNAVLDPNAEEPGGGGIFNYVGTLTVNQSTLSGNVATGGQAGGGIFNDHGTLTLANAIVAGNSATSGADILNLYYSSGSEILEGSNLVQSTTTNNGVTVTGPAPITNAPNLAPLGNYGGPTQTMPPLPGSPAIGAGSVAANTFTNDQRGYPRTQNGLIDIGAVELPTLQFTANPTNTPVDSSVQFNSPSVDSDGSAITQWNWSFGDNTTSSTQNPSHTYAIAGYFTPDLIVTNSLGLTLAASGPSITVSPPVITGISLSGTNLVINGVNGISGLTYYVLTSTNLALPFNQWTPVATNLWNANGSFNLTVTNAVNPSESQQFYLLQAP